jgi:Asp-tRNA(Asn)/Glu-tRNA(Gln) amidotransferase A subunit family amidase
MTAVPGDMLGLSASELVLRLRRRDIGAEELVRASLDRIEAVNATFNAFTAVFADEAIALARLADAALKAGGDTGPMLGLPISIKDFTPTKGHLTTRGSRTLAGNVGGYDPAIVRRLKAAGAIIVAKTTTPEFAHSGFTKSPLWGVTRNPWDDSRSPGGSSGGAAVSVVTGAVALAEGTDMGGSVRIPAALSGCVGLKPSKGRIPIEITATVFDHISHFGPLARSVADAALFLRVTEGPDEMDIQSQINPIPLPATLSSDIRGLRIAASPDLGIYNVDPLVARNFQRSLEVLRDAGAMVDTVDLGWQAAHVSDWVDYWSVFLAAQCGHLLEKDRDLLDPDFAALLDHGLTLDAVAIERGAIRRTEQWQQLARVFATHDALLCPTMARQAPAATDRDADFEAPDASGRLNGLDMTAIFNNVAACPAIAVPNWTAEDGLPTSVQIVGRRFDDPTVLRIAACLEHRAGWPQWSPLTA